LITNRYSGSPRWRHSCCSARGGAGPSGLARIATGIVGADIGCPFLVGGAGPSGLARIATSVAVPVTSASAGWRRPFGAGEDRNTGARLYADQAETGGAGPSGLARIATMW